MEWYVSIESVLDALREVVRTYAAPKESHALLVRQGPIDEVWVTLPAHCLRPALEMMVRELEIWHLSTITASDLRATGAGEGIEVIYHLWFGHGLSLRCTLAYEDPQIDSVSDLIPGAAFYEREAAEMLGIAFRCQAGKEQPDPGRFLLPDDWEGGAPLRHDYVPGQER